MSSESNPPIFLIDGSGYIFRAYYGIRPLSTRDGTPTNAVLGFARMLLKLLREKQPHFLGIAFDARGKNFRHDIYDDYKANRDAPPEDLVPQFSLIHELVDAMDIPRMVIDGFEADDVLATLAEQAKKESRKVVIVSADKDLMQLVSDGVEMYDPMKDRQFDREAVIQKFGVPPELVADALALAGDSSDNIPGVPKVGPKSAAKLLTTYGDLEGVLKGLPDVEKPKAFERSVMENEDSARLSRKLTGLNLEAPVSLDLDALTYAKPDPAKMEPFLTKIEAVSLMKDLGISSDGALESKPREAQPKKAAAKPDPGAHAPVTIDRSTYQTINTEDGLRGVLDAAKSTKVLSVDLETTSLDANRAEIVGVAMCVPGGNAVYVPVSHRYLGVPKQLPLETVLKELRPVLEDPEVHKVGQNLKYDYIVFARNGIELVNIRDDAMLAAYVLNPTRPSFSLDALAREYLAHETIKYKDVAGTGKKQIPFDEVDVPRATEYAGEDADVALQVAERLVADVKAAEMESLYRDIEMPLVPVLASMEHAGIRVDPDTLRGLETEFAERLKKIEETAHAMAGEKVNLASPKQLGVLFFETLGYPVVKKTKTGYSTDQEVLETLSRDYDLPKVVLEHRLLAKLKSTYIDALLRLINPDTGRIHTSYNQTGTATGRLSSTDPNLQNIPIRTEDGRRIRSAFVAEKGHVLISADYSQIELRIMAHLSGDESFVEAFKNEEDIHRRTAMEVLTDGAEPSSEDRRRAKAINFGILYGLSEFGLSRQLGISRSEAHEYIGRYFSRYPGIRRYLDDTIEEGKRLGYVSTLLGRRRFLPELKSKNRNTRQGAERIAMNTPLQGTAADLIKKAMIQVHHTLKERKLESRLLLQVHDELVLEAPTKERAEVEELVRNTMSGIAELAVPLSVEVGHGKTWTEAH